MGVCMADLNTCGAMAVTGMMRDGSRATGAEG